MTEESKEPRTVTIREAVGVFHEWNSLEAAVDELENSGFNMAEISLLAGEQAVQDKLGHVYEKVSELEDDADTPRAAYVARDSEVEAKTGLIGGLAYVGAVAAVGAIVASGGTLAWAIGGAALAGGGGGLIGAAASRLLGHKKATDLQAQLDKGGLLLWVRLKDDAHEKRALEILNAHSGEDVHVHDLERSGDPEGDPMDGFQPDPFLPKARI